MLLPFVDYKLLYGNQKYVNTDPKTQMVITKKTNTDAILKEASVVDVVRQILNDIMKYLKPFMKAINKSKNVYLMALTFD